jgi:tetratricopeptide (TPR) repeat protein
MAWNALGDSKKAITYLEQALAIGRKIYGENHPAVATRLSNLGTAWNALGDSKKAITYLEQAHSIFQEVFGDQHPYTRATKEALDTIKKENK